MARSKQDNGKPRDYFSEVSAAKKPEKSNVPNPITALRSDMVPASNVQPARESVLRRNIIRDIVGILLGLVIISFILFMVIGPGRPILESNLMSLAHKSTPTQASTQTFILPTKAPLEPTQTPEPTRTHEPSPTVQPITTKIVNVIASPTQIPASPTQISPTLTATVPGCRDVLSITLADVGHTLCVNGTVIETITNPTDFLIIFSNKPGAFYWVSYDLVWSKAELRNCYQITGKIDRIGNSPVLVFNYGNLPEACP